MLTKPKFELSSLTDKLFGVIKVKIEDPLPFSINWSSVYIKITWNSDLTPGTLKVILDGHDISDQFTSNGIDTFSRDAFVTTTPGDHTLSVSADLSASILGLINRGTVTRTDSVSFSTQDFKFTVSPQTLIMKGNDTETITINVNREEGYSGTLNFHLQQNPYGISSIPLQIPAQASVGSMQIQSGNTAFTGQIQFNGTGRLDNGFITHSKKLNMIGNNILQYLPSGTWVDGQSQFQSLTDLSGINTLDIVFKLGYLLPTNQSVIQIGLKYYARIEIHFLETSTPILWGKRPTDNRITFWLFIKWPVNTQIAVGDVIKWTEVDEKVQNVDPNMILGPFPDPIECSINSMAQFPGQYCDEWSLLRGNKLIILFPLVSYSAVSILDSFEFTMVSTVGRIPFPVLTGDTFHYQPRQMCHCMDEQNVYLLSIDETKCSHCNRGNFLLPVIPKVISFTAPLVVH